MAIRNKTASGNQAFNVSILSTHIKQSSCNKTVNGNQAFHDHKNDGNGGQRNVTKPQAVIRPLTFCGYATLEVRFNR